MLFNIVKLNLVRYRKNPVIVVPSLVMMVANLLSLLWMPSYLETYTHEFQSYFLVGFGILILILIVSFLALLGQASMAGKVVLGEIPSLSDWVRGVRAYFSRVLGISLIYLGILSLVFIPFGIIYFSLILKPLASQMCMAAPQTPTSAPLTTMWTGTFIGAISTAVIYMWFAPVIFENKGVIASLSSGTRAMRESGRTFLGFIALIFVVLGITSSIANLNLYLGETIQQLLYKGYLTHLNIASQAISTVISPIWFLTAFTIYHELPR